VPTATYVLVHGAWCGAWTWDSLTAEFDRRGVSWRTLDLPSSHDTEGTADLSSDADAVVSAARVDGPVVVVGHSYGGAVVAEAASRIPQLAGLVFVAALVPGPGESATEASRAVRVRTELDDAVVLDEPFLRLDEGRSASALFGECRALDQQRAVSLLGRQTLASFRQPRHEPDPATPRLYVLCEHDRAIDPSVQEVMAQRCDAVVRLSSDHSPFLSHVTETADALIGWPPASATTTA